jgi:hypothetical protein
LWDKGINFHYPFRWAYGSKVPQVSSLKERAAVQKIKRFLSFWVGNRVKREKLFYPSGWGAGEGRYIKCFRDSKVIKQLN